MRLIDAYALQDKIRKSKMQNPHKDAKVAKNHEFEHDHFMQMVVLQPTVQEEIVRCKDCKYSEKINQVYGDDVMYLCNSSVFSSAKCVHLHDADWFCADGERR